MREIIDIMVNNLKGIAEMREERDIWPNDIKKMVERYSEVLPSVENAIKRVNEALPNYGFQDANYEGDERVYKLMD